MMIQIHSWASHSAKIHFGIFLELVNQKFMTFLVMQHKQKLRHFQPLLLENEYLYLAKLI